MKPVLRQLNSPDLNGCDQPDDPESFHVLVQAMIGPDSEAGEESFEFEVLSPDRIVEVGASRWMRSILVLESFSLSEVRDRVEKLLRHCEGDSWAKVAAKLSRYMNWEYEEYENT